MEYGDEEFIAWMANLIELQEDGEEEAQEEETRDVEKEEEHDN